MNFFKSVFSDEPESGSADSDPPPQHSAAAAVDSTGGTWNIGGFLKTLSSKSESIIETYRRDLQEFGTGLKKEIEVAQGSLDELGTTVVKGTAQIISQGKDAILAVDLDSDSDRSVNADSNRLSTSGSNKERPYNRFDAAVRAIQGDAATYTEEPEDLEEFGKWRLGFSIDEKRSGEMERVLRENEAMEGIYKSVVSSVVDHETFWSRYYYKVYRIKKAEDVRAKLVGRISTEDEDLNWDVEDDDDDDDEDDKAKMVDMDLRVGGDGNGNERGSAERLAAEEVKSSGEEGVRVEKGDDLLESKQLGKQIDESFGELCVAESEGVGGGSKETIGGVGVDEMSKLKLGDVVSKNDDSVVDSDEKMISERDAENVEHRNGSAAELDEKAATERKVDDGESSGRNDEPSVVGNKQLAHDEEEDEEELGWEEIEDLSSVDEMRTTPSGGSTSKADLRKRLSATEEEEDLSWDVEDDDEDEPAKA